MHTLHHIITFDLSYQNHIHIMVSHSHLYHIIRIHIYKYTYIHVAIDIYTIHNALRQLLIDTHTYRLLNVRAQQPSYHIIPSSHRFHTNNQQPTTYHIHTCTYTQKKNISHHIHIKCGNSFMYSLITYTLIHTLVYTYTYTDFISLPNLSLYTYYIYIHISTCILSPHVYTMILQQQSFIYAYIASYHYI